MYLRELYNYVMQNIKNKMNKYNMHMRNVDIKVRRKVEVKGIYFDTQVSRIL